MPGVRPRFLPEVLALNGYRKDTDDTSGRKLFRRRWALMIVVAVAVSTPSGRGNAQAIQKNFLHPMGIMRASNEAARGAVFSPVRQVVFSPNGQIIASCNGKSVKLWNVTQRKLISTLRGHRRDVYAVAFSPSSSALASGGNDGTLRIWDVDEGKQIKEMNPQVGTITGLSFLSDGKTIVVESSIRTSVTLCNIDTGNREGVSFKNSVWAMISCSQVSADRGHLAVGGHAASVAIYDIEKRKVVTKLTTLPKGVRNLNNVHQVNSVAFSPDKELLAVSCGFKIPSVVTLWDLPNRSLKSIVYSADPSALVSETVGCVRFSPDGSFLAFSGDKLFVWDLKNEKELASWKPPAAKSPFEVTPCEVAFSPKHRLIATGLTDGGVALIRYTPTVENRR